MARTLVSEGIYMLSVVSELYMVYNGVLGEYWWNKTSIIKVSKSNNNKMKWSCMLRELIEAGNDGERWATRISGK